jgi:hypothetical protein
MTDEFPVMTPALAKGMRTPKGTDHQPTHKRLQNGKLVPLNDSEPYLGWMELVMEYTFRQREKEEENPPEINKRLGAFYAETRTLPRPKDLIEWVCSLCTLPMSAEKCEHPNGVDKWDSHAVARYDGRKPNRAARRAAGWSTRHAKVLHIQLGVGWSRRHSKAEESAA